MFSSKYSFEELVTLVSVATKNKMIQEMCSSPVSFRFLCVEKEVTLQDNVCFSSDELKTQYYIFSEDSVCLQYIAFLLNSTLGKMNLATNHLNSPNHRGIVTLKTLSTFPVPIVDVESRESIIKLYKLINGLDSMSDGIDVSKYAPTLKRFLVHVQNSIITELYFSELLEKNEIKILEPWSNEVIGKFDNVDSNPEIFWTSTQSLFESVLSPHNLLFDNINKISLILQDESFSIKGF